MLRHGTNRLHPRQRGFTLVELLVVIVIIGVLIGITMPVMSTVRGASRRTLCASNMRQLAAALISYASQNKSAFPPNSGQLGQFWYLEGIIGPHVTAPDRVGRAGADRAQRHSHP